MSSHGDMYDENDDPETYYSIAERQSVVIRRTWWSGFLIGAATASVVAALIVHFTL